MSRPIIDPKLPPLPGYVEVELEDGTRTYESTQETKSKDELIAENALLRERLQSVDSTLESLLFEIIPGITGAPI
jgi:hypothetical protein